MTISQNEHKAVAFDVYRAVRGTYFIRVTTMAFTTVIFWAVVIMQQLRLMWVDGCAFSVREWGRLGRYLFLDPGGMGSLVRPYLSYYAPSFHPWKHDNRALLEAWKVELGRSPVYESALRTSTAGS